MAEELMALDDGTRVSDRWIVIEILGAGAFGAVYLCKNDQGAQGALKTEPIDAQQPLLVMEATVLRALEGQHSAFSRHFCRCLDLGRDGQMNIDTGRRTEFNFIVMTLVGRPLDSLVKESGDRFSPGTAIGLSIQLLNALQALHEVGYLHRDIKPANTAIGRPENNEQRLLYLIDFGMARKYIRDDGSQRRARESASFRGTPIYAPISAHINRDYSRKDDVESWFYVLIKFYKGAVPWKRVRDVREIGAQKCRRMADQPDDVRLRALTELTGGCPDEFNHILAHIDRLAMDERPNYEGIEQMLRGHLSNNRINEHPYDWEMGGGGGGGTNTTHGHGSNEGSKHQKSEKKHKKSSREGGSRSKKRK